eukprot:PhM_4_TR17459/c0_g1_i1/m.36756
MAERMSMASSVRSGVAGGSIFAARLPLFPFIIAQEGTFSQVLTQLGLLVEFMQYLGYSLNVRYASGKILDSEAVYITYVTLLPFWDDELVNISTSIIQAVFWVLCAFVIILSIRLVVGVFWGTDTRQVNAGSMTTRSTLHAISSFLYTPIVLWLLSCLVCNTADKLWTMPSESCWGTMHIAMFVVGVPSLLLYILVSLMVNTFLYEDNPHAKHMLRRPHTHVDAFAVFLKTSLAVLYHALLSSGNLRTFQWCNVTLHLMFAGLNVFMLPYYDITTTRIKVMTSVCAATTAALMGADEDSDLPSILVLGLVPLAGFFSWCAAAWRINGRCRELISMLRTGEEVNHLSVMPGGLPRHAQLFSPENEMKHHLQDALQMLGEMHEHEQEGIEEEFREIPPSSVLEPYINHVYTPSDVELATRHLVWHKQVLHRELPAPMVQHARRIFTKGTIKFRTNAEVYHAFSLFVDFHAASASGSKELRFRALALCDQTHRLDALIHTRYAIFRHSLRISQDLGIRDKTDKQIALLAEKYFLESLSHITAFWQHLTEPNVDTMHLATVASAISLSRDRAMTHFKKTLVNHFNDARFVQRYGQFLGQVMLDSDAHQACQKEVADIEADKKAMVMGGTKAKQSAQIRGEDSYKRLLELAEKPLDTLNTSRSLTSSIANISRSGGVGMTLFLGIIVATMVVGIMERDSMTQLIDTFHSVGLVRTTSQQMATVAQRVLVLDGIPTEKDRQTMRRLATIFAESHRSLTTGSYRTDYVPQRKYFTEPQIEYVEYTGDNLREMSVAGMWQYGNLITEAAMRIGDAIGLEAANVSDVMEVKNAARFVADVPYYFFAAANETVYKYENQNDVATQRFLTVFTVLLVACVVSVVLLYIMALEHFQTITGNKTTTLQLFTMISHDNIETIVTKARSHLDKLEGSMEAMNNTDDNERADSAEDVELDDDLSLDPDDLSNSVRMVNKSFAASLGQPPKGAIRDPLKEKNARPVTFPDVLVTTIYEDEVKEEKEVSAAQQETTPTDDEDADGEQQSSERRKRTSRVSTRDYGMTANVVLIALMVIAAAAIFALSFSMRDFWDDTIDEFEDRRKQVRTAVNLTLESWGAWESAVAFNINRDNASREAYDVSRAEVRRLRWDIMIHGVTREEAKEITNARAQTLISDTTDAEFATEGRAALTPTEMFNAFANKIKAIRFQNTFTSKITRRLEDETNDLYDEAGQLTEYSLHVLVAAFTSFLVIATGFALHTTKTFTRPIIVLLICVGALQIGGAVVLSMLVSVGTDMKDTQWDLMVNEAHRNTSLTTLYMERSLTRLYVYTRNEQFVTQAMMGNETHIDALIPTYYQEDSDIVSYVRALRNVHATAAVMAWWPDTSLPNKILGYLNATTTWNYTAEPGSEVQTLLFPNSHMYTTRSLDEARNATEWSARAINSVFGSRYNFLFDDLLRRVNNAFDNNKHRLESSLDDDESKANAFTLVTIIIWGVFLGFVLLLATTVSAQVWSSSSTAKAAEKDPVFQEMAARSRNSLLALAIFAVVILIVGHVLVNQSSKYPHNINDATSREWFVGTTLYHIQTILNFTDPLVKFEARRQLSRTLGDMREVRHRLFFTSSGYNAVGSDRTQDTLLFGSDDGQGLLPTQTTAFRTVCDTTSTLTYGSLNNATNEVDLQYLTWIQDVMTYAQGDGMPAGATASSLLASADVLIAQLQESSSTMETEARDDITNVFLIVVILLGVLIALSLLVLLIVFIPIVRKLAHEQESTLLMLRMIPNDVRDSVPAISEFLETGKIDTTKEAQMNFEKSERLLQNILPQKISKRLKAGETPIADEHQDVTILFSDFVNFTLTSSSLSAPEVVEFLNDVFCEFDVICDLLEVEKIKTIGDAYFVVGGLDEAQVDHCMRVCECALHMFKALNEHNEIHYDRHPLGMRLGIHTGPAVAGVIGLKKVAYDLWGDTIVLANKMESSGSPMRVHISQDVYKVVEPFYLVAVRHEPPAGPGGMRTYLIIGRKAATPYMTLKRPKLMKAKITGTGVKQTKPTGK